VDVLVKLLPLLHRVLVGYIPHDAVKSHPLALPIPLPPHEFVKVAGDLVCMAALDSLQLSLDPVPIRLRINAESKFLRVHTSNRVNKSDRVVHSAMGCYRWQSGYSAICPPLIRMDDCPGSYRDGPE